jgi:hypothetical protein
MATFVSGPTAISVNSPGRCMALRMIAAGPRSGPSGVATYGK